MNTGDSATPTVEIASIQARKKTRLQREWCGRQLTTFQGFNSCRSTEHGTHPKMKIESSQCQPAKSASRNEKLGDSFKVVDH
jgi:hypothetical protein